MEAVKWIPHYAQSSCEVAMIHMLFLSLTLTYTPEYTVSPSIHFPADLNR
jgi:hypothetical protein